MPRDTSSNTQNVDLPSRAAYLGPDAEFFSTELLSLADVGRCAQRTVRGWLRSRTTGDAVEFLSGAVHDFALWFAAHGGVSPVTLTIGWEEPRILITLQDRGLELPDLHRSRRDVAMIHRTLGHHVTEWECDLNAAGLRTARIYGDVTADEDADREEWPE